MKSWSDWFDHAQVFPFPPVLFDFDSDSLFSGCEWNQKSVYNTNTELLFTINPSQPTRVSLFLRSAEGKRVGNLEECVFLGFN